MLFSECFLVMLQSFLLNGPQSSTWKTSLLFFFFLCVVAIDLRHAAYGCWELVIRKDEETLFFCYWTDLLTTDYDFNGLLGFAFVAFECYWLTFIARLPLHSLCCCVCVCVCVSELKYNVNYYRNSKDNGNYFAFDWMPTDFILSGGYFTIECVCASGGGESWSVLKMIWKLPLMVCGTNVGVSLLVGWLVQ